MIVDEHLATQLAACDGRMLRTYVAGCVERLAPVFGAQEAFGSLCSADVDAFVGAVDALWDVEATIGDLEAHRGRIQGLVATMPDTCDVAGYGEDAFYAALVLVHALTTVLTGSIAPALQCTHAALSARELIDDHDPALCSLDRERARMRRCLDLLHAGEPAIDLLREDDRRIGRELLARLADGGDLSSA